MLAVALFSLQLNYIIVFDEVNKNPFVNIVLLYMPAETIINTIILFSQVLPHTPPRWCGETYPQAEPLQSDIRGHPDTAGLWPV